MVAVIHSGDLTELLDRADAHGSVRRFTLSWRRIEWRGGSSHLCLLVYEDQVRWLGRANPGNNITTLERRIEVVDIEEVEPLPLPEIIVRLPAALQEHFRPGVLPAATGEATVDVLRELLPHHGPLITRLNTPYRRSRPTGRRDLPLEEQRDGTGLVLEFSGVGRSAVRDWRADPQAPSFLAGVQEQRFVSEETLIDHDVARFPGLVERLNAHVDWRVFRNRNSSVFVLNANQEPLEQVTGTDLIYWHEEHQSFVLVQYKRMKREAPDGGASSLGYRPDAQMNDEIARMREIDLSFGSSADGSFRLYDRPCWIKLCDPTAAFENPRALIKGMYFTREHFEELLTTVPRGPKGGVRIGYATAARHINNTMFADLVRDAWVGTRGTGTTELGQLISQTLADRRALVFGAGLRASRQRSRR